MALRDGAFEEPANLTNLTILITGAVDGTLILSLCGTLPIAQLHLSGPSAMAVSCCVSGDLSTLLVWVQTIQGPKLDAYSLEFLAKDQCKVYPHARSLSVLPLGQVLVTLVAHIKATRLLGEISKARTAVVKTWEEVLASLERKLTIYVNSLQDWRAARSLRPSAKSELLSLVATVSRPALTISRFSHINANRLCMVRQARPAKISLRIAWLNHH